MNTDETRAPGLVDDLGALRRALARLPFPATQDDALALLVARRASSRLLWRLAPLSPTRCYGSLDEVCREVRAAAGTSMPPPPGR